MRDQTETRGYHETLTLAWARLIAARMGSCGEGEDFAAFIRRHPDLLTSAAILRYYSRERIFSLRARREFVLPDLEPLPREAPERGTRLDDAA